VLSYDLLFNETLDATNNVVKVGIAKSCDDLVVESIEQGFLIAKASKWLWSSPMMIMS
jgi:hypothetical protein